MHGMVHDLSTNVCFKIDSMAVVQESIAVKSIQNSKNLNASYVALINIKTRNCHAPKIVFVNYSIRRVAEGGNSRTM